MKRSTLNKRLNSLLRTQCSGCARCCKEPLVPITHSDLKRIMKRTGQKPHEIVNFVPTSAINFEKDSQYWIQFGRKRRVMILTKTSEQCQYLNDQNRCSIYNSRPITCRTFPITIHLDENNRIETASLNRIIKDRYPKGSKNPLKDLLNTAITEHQEDTAFHELIEMWNLMYAHPSEDEFLKFITT